MTPEAASQTTVRPQASDDKLQASLRQLARQMSDLSDRLDRAASLSERASRIVGQPGASGAATGPARATVERGTAAPGPTGETTMAALEQLVSRRRDVLALTQSLSAKFSGPQRAGAGRRAVERSPSAKPDASLEALKALSTDLATADFRPDVQAAQATLDASRKAAQDAARAAWGKASRATIDTVVPKRISAKVVPAAGAKTKGAKTNFSATSVEDHLTLVFVLSTGEGREGLKTVLQSTASANDRLYHAATRAQTVIDGARIDLLLAVADTHLTARSTGRPGGDDIASMVDYQINRAGLPKTDARNQQLKKLADELDVLRQQRRDIIPQIMDLKLESLQLNADCAAAASRVADATARAQKAAEAASTGALIGGIFGGPAGAALGAAMAVAAAGGVPSPEDLATLEDCKRAAELEQRIGLLQLQLDEIGKRIEAAIQAIEQIKSIPEVVKATAPAVPPGGLTRPRPSAKNPPAATASRPAGSSGINTSRSNSAMDRLTGGGGGLSSAAGSSGSAGAPARRPPSAGGSAGSSSGINTSRPAGGGSGSSSGVYMSRQP
jgi:hypothetical protein